MTVSAVMLPPGIFSGERAEQPAPRTTPLPSAEHWHQIWCAPTYYWRGHQPPWAGAQRYGGIRGYVAPPLGGRWTSLLCVGRALGTLVLAVIV